MTKIQDDIFYFRHPLNANCVVFAFLTGSGDEIDLIDTGISSLGILRNTIKQMRKDGLNDRNIRNIYHTHAHFDHVQADRIMQERALKYRSLNGNSDNETQIYVPEPDLYRFLPKYNVFDVNLQYIKKFLSIEPEKAFPKIPFVGKYILEPLMHYKIPNHIRPLKNEQIIEIGRYKARVITTGGHTEGHSFFHIPELNILHTGDNNALNELIVDFGAVINSMLIIRDIDPDMIFIGHNAPRLNKNDSLNWTNSWFDGYEKILEMLKPLLKNNATINITKIMKTMLGYLYNIEIIRFFSFMQLFVILKFFEEKKFGKIVIEESIRPNDKFKIAPSFSRLFNRPNYDLKFHTANNIEDIELKLF